MNRLFPLVWLFVGVVAIGAISAVTASGVVLPLVGAAAALVVYWVVMRFVAKRDVPELRTRRLGVEIGSGLAIGAGFVTVSVAVIVLLGGYSLAWHAPDGLSVLAPLVAVAVGAGLTEELLFRGLAFQAIERIGSSALALIITSVLFGAVHLGAPGATLWSSIAIGVEAGVLLGAAFLWRRSIWFVAGIHIGWNVVEGVLGIPVSGHTEPGLFVTTVSGNDLLTGGGFGLEASLVPVVVSVALSVPMLLAARVRLAQNKLRVSERNISEHSISR